MTRLQLSILLAMLGALSAVSGCEGEDDPACVGFDCANSPGMVVGTGGTGGVAGSPGGPTGGPGAGASGGTTGGALSGAGSLGGTGTGVFGGTIGPGATTGGASGTTGGGLTAGLTGGGVTGGSTTGGGTTGSGFLGGLLGGGFIGGGTAGGALAGGGTGGGTTDGGMLPPSSGNGMPKIPEVTGECPQFRTGTVMVAGHRGIQLTVGPAGMNGALLFYWHGTGGSSGEASLMLSSSVRNEITSTGGIIASFNGSSSSQAEGDCSGTAAHNMADFKAADQLAACAVKNHGIDPRRIYTTGCSAGGLQSGCMAQVRSSYIAAAAPNSGGVVFPQRWQDTGTPAIFTMHGGSSDWVIVSFDQTSATLDMSAKSHGSFVVNCNHGGGHCAAPTALYTAAWKFMKDHPYGAESPWKGGIPSGVPSYCMIY